MSHLEKISKVIIKHATKAEEVYKGINGIFCVYKPAGRSRWQVKEALIKHICRDMNELDVRPPENFVHIDGETNKQLTVRVEPSYADHPLIVGPRYQPEDFRIREAHHLSNDMSGVMLVGLNKGTTMIRNIAENNPMRFFKVKGILGQATKNFFIDGKIVEKSTFRHVKRHHLDMICASMQSSHQRKMFELCGVDIQSQAAYDLAVQGPIRPTENKVPMVYSIKCINFEPPEVTLEVACINENDMFIKSLIHALGIEARTTATCTQLQCFQYGVFTLNNALLKRDWDLDKISENMLEIRNILGQHKYLFKQDDPNLREHMDMSRTAHFLDTDIK